ncbi:MAG: hypothetical protein U1F41_17485 [Burkholderiales bacterium]
MGLRFRILGLVIFACGAAFCRGAYLLWPSLGDDATTGSLALAALFVALSCVAGALGVLNVLAGAVVLFKPPRA